MPLNIVAGVPPAKTPGSVSVRVQAVVVQL